MPTIKFSSKIDEETWGELKLLAKESHQNITGLLNEAVSDYVNKRRLRPSVTEHLMDSIQENEELGKLLAK